MLTRFNPTPDLDLPLRNNLSPPLDPIALGRIGVHFVVLDRAIDPRAYVPGWVGPTAQDDRFVVYENPMWRGEAVAWRSAMAMPAAAIQRALGAAAADFQDTVLVTDPDDVRSCDRTCDPVGLGVTRSTPEHATTMVDLDVPSIVALDQQFDGGWHVSVDGRAAPAIEADGFVVAVAVPAGRHTVVWSYRPGWLTPSLVVAVLTLLATVGLAISPTAASWIAARRMRGADPAAP
jgi:hypothetical protein